MVCNGAYDIIAITETWLNEAYENVINIPGYTVIRKDRTNAYANEHHRCRGGGVLLFARDSLKAIEIDKHHDSNCDTVWCSITLGGNKEKYTIGCIYRTPSSSRDDTEILCEHIRSLCSSMEKTNIVILGDFNFPTINWASNTFPSVASSLESLINDCLLTQHISQPTR
jgi:hypothetical protein